MMMAGKCECRGAARLAAGILALWTAACSDPGMRRETAGDLSGQVQILQPFDLQAYTQTVEQVLGRAFPSARTFPLQKWDQAFDQAREHGAVLVIPAADRLPSDLWEPLQQFLDAGGRALFLGTAPFGQRVWSSPSGLRTERELAWDFSAAAQAVDGLAPVQQWRLRKERDGLPDGSLRAVSPSPEMPWAGVQVDVADFTEWTGVELDDIDAKFPATANALVFFARGGEGTDAIVLECVEQDGSHWMQVVSLEAGWKPVALRVEGFRHLHGGRDRGGTGDQLHLRKLARISAGLSMQHHPLLPGVHRFALSDLRVYRDPRPASQAVAWPDVPLLSPSFRRYPGKVASIRVAGLEEDFRFVQEQDFSAPLPLADGTGAGAPHRWITVAEGLAPDGSVRGAAASLYLEPAAEGLPRRWGWIGLDARPENAAALEAMLRELAARLLDHHYLVHAGLPKSSVESGERMEVSILPVHADAVADGYLEAELRQVGGPVLRHNSMYLDEKREPGPVTLTLGAAPEVQGLARDYELRVRMLDPERRYLRDEVVQQVKVFPVRAPRPERGWVGAVGAAFTVDGRPQFFLGMNYWPHRVNGKAAGDFNPHWLDPAVFDPVAVRRDLDVLRNLGVNCIALQYLAVEQAPQLRFVFDELRRRRMWAYVFVNHLQPLYQDLAKAEQLVKAARLAEEPALFGIDIAWEPHLGGEKDRHRFDEAWRAWVLEQFGTEEHAEHMAGRPLWRNADGKLTGPPDEELIADGDHRVAVAIYRRFVDDYISRRYGAVRRLVRGLGVQQLLSARSGYGGSGNPWADRFLPVDLATGAVHLDFIAPEAWGLTGGRDQFLEAGFITAYARGAGGGKPVAWVEFGSTVGLEPGAGSLRNQARVYGHMLELLQLSRSAAGFGWWYPGGNRVDEDSDMGLVAPDYSERPACEPLRAFAHRMREMSLQSAAWQGRELVRSSDARGLSGYWESWRATYREETASNKVGEIRFAQFGRKSGGLELLAIGGRLPVAPCAMESVNAEWGEVRSGDQVQARAAGAELESPLRKSWLLEIINTGPVTWSASDERVPGSVWIKAQADGGRENLIRIPELPFGGKAQVRWLAADPGAWILRPCLNGGTPFGEPLAIRVADQPAP